MKEKIIVRYRKMKYFLQHRKEKCFRYFVNVLGVENQDEANCNDINEEREPIFRVLFNVLLIALTFSLLVLVLNFIVIEFSEDHNPGTFGDFMGGILNPIFTLFMLFGLIVTIVVQRQELKLARKEFGKSAEALSTQVFDNTFFNLIELHHKIIDSLRVAVFFKIVVTTYLIFTLLDITRFLAHLDLTSQAQQGRNF